MPENDAFPAPHHRYRHGSRIIHQHFILLYPDVKHLPAVAKNTVKLENLLLIGYSPNRVALPYNILTCGLNLAVLILSVGGVAWVRSYYTEIIGTLFPQLETGTLLPCWTAGCLLCLAVSSLNIVMIRRKS